MTYIPRRELFDERVLLSEKQVQGCVRRIGTKLSKDYNGKFPVFIAILKGGAVFLIDLVRAMRIPVEIDFMSVSSYGSAMTSSGDVKIIHEIRSSIRGRDVVVVEGVVDTGLTLRYVLNYLQSKEPRSLEVCTLLDKESCRQVEIPLAYVGFKIGQDFVVGYGLDYDEEYRNLPYVAVLDPKKPKEK